MPPKDETQKLAEPEREKEKKLAVEEHFHSNLSSMHKSC